ncbi:hypothetical protein GF323_04800 [Candidatus Woesearchaeota archaeon]|nr:hypothetical protein [Candidatus Woesearchaeota archaeon]
MRVLQALAKVLSLENIKKSINDNVIYAYTEEELLFGWRHNFIPGITEIRLNYFEKIIDYIEEKLRNEDCIFILERFHISLKIFNWDSPVRFEKKYKKIISRVQSLPVYLLIFTLDASQIEKRQKNKEKAWHEYQGLKKKILNFRVKGNSTQKNRKQYLI